MHVVAVTCLLCVHRPDGKVAFGYSLFRGKRSNMEDFHQAQVTVLAHYRVAATCQWLPGLGPASAHQQSAFGHCACVTLAAHTEQLQESVRYTPK
jgi:hypothetical protein